MDHNVFDFDEDLINPFKAFLKKIDESIAAEKRRPLKGAAAEKKGPTVVKIDESTVVIKGNSQSQEKIADFGEGEEGTDSNNASSS
jgi:hypothetical protein